jgi:hypothetical protein
MSIYLKIIIAVAAVVLIGRKVWVITAGRKRREHQELVRRRKEDAEREELYAWRNRKTEVKGSVGTPEDDTKTWPGPEASA